MEDMERKVEDSPSPLRDGLRREIIGLILMVALIVYLFNNELGFRY